MGEMVVFFPIGLGLGKRQAFSGQQVFYIVEEWRPTVDGAK